MKGTNGSDIEGLSLPVDEDFDPNIQLDNLAPKTTPASTIDVKLWAQTICSQLVLYLGHWPLWSGCQTSSSVCEQHDTALGSELGSAVLSAPHVQLMRFSDATLASLVELPAIHPPCGGTTPGLMTSDRQVRVLLRDICGKACWDASALYYDPSVASSEALELLPLPKSTFFGIPIDVGVERSSSGDRISVLAYIGHTSPEVTCGRRLDEVGTSPLATGLEDELVCALVAHRNSERHYLANRDSDDESEGFESCSIGEPGPFEQSRLLVSQLGTLGAARRPHAQLLRRSDRLLRELRNLDAQRCRETHKVAVIYVGKGQETRNEILSNRCGSSAYEAFLSALAWEVELESHVGFTGGLRGGGGGGVSAPYIATLTLEALFHVATRMPADTPDAILNKVSKQIPWSSKIHVEPSRGPSPHRRHPRDDLSHLPSDVVEPWGYSHGELSRSPYSPGKVFSRKRKEDSLDDCGHRGQSPAWGGGESPPISTVEYNSHYTNEVVGNKELQVPYKV
ncbi:jg10252 [Pararge aegeria aegeria]|uniref:Jg10252 protein n=1 Tax=Pararge aegeria aegeria TaxID=348720 RepID=A0A8S4SE09_9NEOP|nr:jg10252 [Pararge aegeria aegeria]